MDIWDYSKRSISFERVWPAGLGAFLEELTALGFEPKLPSHLALESSHLNLRLGRITHARGSNQEVDVQGTAFTYLQGRTALLRFPERWGLVFVDKINAPSFKAPGANVIEVKSPEAAADYLLRKLSTPEWFPESGDSSLGLLAERFPGVHFESLSSTVVGPHTQIAPGTRIEAGVRIGARVSIGPDCRIGAHTRLADDTELGARAMFTGFASIGGQGFGFIRYPKDSETRQRLHVGRVKIGSDARLGAFTAIDRGVFEDTLIGDQCAFDNLVQIAHNCEIGPFARLCAFVGLSGSTKLGHHVTVGGMVGSKGHLSVGNNVFVGGQSGITTDIEDGAVVKGYPPKPIKEALKIALLQSKLPEIYDRLRGVERLIQKQRVQSEADPLTTKTIIPTEKDSK